MKRKHGIVWMISLALLMSILPSNVLAKEGLPQLATPRAFWDENYRTCWETYQPTQNIYEYKLYRVGEENPIHVIKQSQGDDYQKVITNNYFTVNIENLKNGTYYFTVQAIGDGVHYSDSEISISEELVYTKPERILQPATNLEWNFPYIKWTSSPDEENILFYIANFYFAETEMEEPRFIASGYNAMVGLRKEILQQYGEGFYYAAIFGISENIMNGQNTPLSQLSPAYHYTKVSSDAISYSEVEFLLQDEQGYLTARTEETNFGNLVADAVYYHFQDDEVDCAIGNGGWLRSEILAGEITYQMCHSVLAFEDEMWLVEVSGQQILDALEWGTQYIRKDEKQVFPGFPQVSGLRYTVNTAIPSTVQLNNGNWGGVPTGKYRVTEVEIWNRANNEYCPLDINAVYKLATTDFLLWGGDGYAMLINAPTIKKSELMDYDVLAEYFKSFPIDENTGLPTLRAGGKYDDPKGEGRLSIIYETESEEIPIPTPTPAPSRPSGDNSSSNSYSVPSYSITALTVSNGKVTFSSSRAEKGSKVTFTVIPDIGYKLESLAVSDSNGRSLSFTDLNNGKYTFTMPDSKVEVKAVFMEEASALTVFSNPFTDISAENPHYTAVEYVYNLGLMKGLTETIFGPNTAASRAMIVTLLYRIEDEPKTTGTTFFDVSVKAYYAAPVAWATDNGVVVGNQDGSFRPDDGVTWEQLATILYRYAGVKGYDQTSRVNLNTSQISSFAREPLSWMLAQGLIDNVQYRSPKTTVTRAEVAEILMFFCENMAK